MLPCAPPASRRSNRSVRACVSISVASPRASHAASQSVTTTDRNTCPTLSERVQIPRHRTLACLRPGARGKRLRRALHPNAQGEPPVDPDLRYNRATPESAACLPRYLQRHLADRTPWIHHAASLSAKTPSTRGACLIASNSVSQQLRALQELLRPSEAARLMSVRPKT